MQAHGVLLHKFIFVCMYATYTMSERKLTYDHKGESESKRERTTAMPTIYARAKAIKRIHKVAALGNTWLVSSGTVKNKFYVVSFDKSIQALRCECKAFEFNQYCKHLIAVSEYEHGKGII